MNSKIIWNDQIPERDGVQSPINDIAVSPDGSRVIVATGNRVLLYKTENGDLIESLRGHKDQVYTVSFSGDGSRFASGGADNIVVIWKITGQGLLKYNHAAPIQKVAYSPTMLLLASCSEVDFGLWTPDQKQVVKDKVSSRILSAAWSSDGSMLALGMLSGLISIRNQSAQEIFKIERKAPIWCMTFVSDTTGPNKAGFPASMLNFGGGNAAGPTSSNEMNDSLAVGCWDKTYSLYRINNNTCKIQHEKKLKYYPCSIAYSANQASKSSYLIITGSNKKATVYSREGSKLTEIASKDSWVWCCDSNGDSETVAIGSQAGSIDYMKMNFDKVHSMFKDRYTYRENLTEVIVQHFVTEKKVRIKCKDLIQNLSLYKNKLAVQLSDRVCIYESSPDNLEDMHFRLRKEKIIIQDFSSKDHAYRTHIVITAMHLLFGCGKVLELYSFDGQRVRVWTFDADISFLKVDGGPSGCEGVLIGLESGQVAKVFVNNPFPLELYKLSHGIKQLDINIYRTIIAAVDSSNTLTLTDLRTQIVLHTSSGITSACFNTEVEDLLCLTSVDSSILVLTLTSITKPDPSGQPKAAELQEQHIYGLTLGYRGQKIFCLYRGTVIGVDVPQGHNIQRALESNDITTAYKIACLGATEAEWKLVAMRALRTNNLRIAQKAYSRLKDTKFLTLIDTIERRSTGMVASKVPPPVCVPPPSSDLESKMKAADPVTERPKGRVRDRGIGGIGGIGGSAESADAKITSSQVSSIGIVTPPLEFTWLAELMAYEGHHHEAAKIYARNGRLDEAIRLFTDLKQWEDAKMFARNAGQVDLSALTLQQAKWLQEIKDWKGSAEMYMSVGQFIEAARSIGENRKRDNELPGWQEALIEVVRACPVDNMETLQYCGDIYSEQNETAYAKETYIKANDISKLMALYAKRQMWNEAGLLADEHEGLFDVSIFLSYAEWLISQDRYEDAMVALKKAKRLDLSRKVLEELTSNAVTECRFKDAAYYYWMLSKETELEIVEAANAAAASQSEGKNSDGDSQPYKEDQSTSRLQYEYEHKADLYFAYANVHAYTTDPFTSLQPEMIFQVSRFIINSLGSSGTMPAGISKASTIYTLARQAMVLGAFKLARDAYDRLSKLQIPNKRIDEVEIDMLLVQAKPVRDNPDHLPVCYRCSMPNPLLNPFTNKFAKGDVCTNCGHPFVRSFINFDILPLVEFVPDPSISDEEAIDMIRQPPPMSRAGFYSSSSKNGGDGDEFKADDKGSGSGWKESKNSGADMLTLDRDGANEVDDATEDAVNEALGINSGEQDIFTRCLNLTLERQKGSYTPVKVDANTLNAMKRSEVFVCRPSSKTKRATFYRNMLPDIPIAISQPCHRFFHLEDFEFAYLSEQKCPYSRLKNVGEYGSL